MFITVVATAVCILKHDTIVPNAFRKYVCGAASPNIKRLLQRIGKLYPRIGRLLQGTGRLRHRIECCFQQAEVFLQRMGGLARMYVFKPFLEACLGLLEFLGLPTLLRTGQG